jgi:hypothetical protein
MITDAQDVLVKNAEASLSSMKDVVMPDKNPLLSGLENQGNAGPRYISF